MARVSCSRGLQWLAAHDGWLLILDNVENPLCDALGHLPLAVEQAAAYLAQNPATTPRAYLRLLKEYPASLFDRGGAATKPERTLARIWRVSFDRIAAREPFAIDLLLVLAWYAPDRIHATLYDKLGDSPTVNAAIGQLSAYSLVTLDTAGTVAVHRTVQAVCRTPDPHDPHRARVAIETARTRATHRLADLLPDSWQEPTTRPVWRVLTPHVDVLAEHTQPSTDTAVTWRLLRGTSAFGRPVNSEPCSRTVEVSPTVPTGRRPVADAASAAVVDSAGGLPDSCDRDSGPTHSTVICRDIGPTIVSDYRAYPRDQEYPHEQHSG